MGEHDFPARRWISRDGIVAPDPIDGLRDFMSDGDLSSFDEKVTNRAPAFALDSAAGLEAQRKRIADRLRETWDPDRLRRAEQVERQIAVSSRHLLKLHEDLFVSSGTSRGRLPQPEREALIQGRRAALREATARHQGLREQIEVTDRGVYSSFYFSDHSRELKDLFAIERELVLREARAASERGEPSVSVELPEGAEVRDLDPDAVARARDERERTIDSDLDLFRIPEPTVKQIAREDVPHPELFERIGDALGERRTEELKTRAGPLARFAATQPAHSILAKRDASGSLLAGLDKKAARRAVRLESLSRIAQEQREQSLANVERFAASDPERSAAEQRTAAWCEQKLAGYRQGLDTMRANQVHPDQWLAANEEKLIVAAVYERENTIRDRLEVAELVERAVAGRSRNPERLLGEFPKTTSQQERWLELARPVEKLRIEGERAERLGESPPVVDPRALQELNRDIDRFRESRGMEALAQAPQQLALERGSGPGFG